MTAANCGIIISGHFNAFFLLSYPGVEVGQPVKVRDGGEGCHLAVLAFAPKTKILLLYVLETSCVCNNSHLLSKLAKNLSKIAYS